MSVEIEINGQGSRLRVEVLGYENPSAQDISDANWLRCQVMIKIGEAFLADFPASFTTSDFVRFRDELSTVLTKLSGTASFLTDEEALSLSIDIGRTGGALVSGVAQTEGQPQASLSFSFDSDQSFLIQTLHGLDALVTHFPIKEHSSITELL